MPDPRERLLKRVEAEAGTFANSEGSMAQLRLGRVYGLLRGDAVTLWRVTDIAEFLGLSHQRVDQLLQEGRLPPPPARSGRTRLWERSDIGAWADAEWWDSRRWRQRR